MRPAQQPVEERKLLDPTDQAPRLRLSDHNISVAHHNPIVTTTSSTRTIFGSRSAGATVNAAAVGCAPWRGRGHGDDRADRMRRRRYPSDDERGNEDRYGDDREHCKAQRRAQPVE